MDRTCIICNKVIDPERIENIPETGLCTEHAKRAAELGGEFLLGASVGNSSKQGSLKKNYGGGVSSITKYINEPVLAKLHQEYEASCAAVRKKAETTHQARKPVKRLVVDGFDKFGGREGTSKSSINLAILNGAKKLREIICQSKQPRKNVVNHLAVLFLEGLVELNKRNEIVPAKRRRIKRELTTR